KERYVVGRIQVEDALYADGHGQVILCQAENGIRDRNVTGVQTCALPISTTASSTGRPRMLVSTSSQVATSAPLNREPAARRSLWNWTSGTAAKTSMNPPKSLNVAKSPYDAAKTP